MGFDGYRGQEVGSRTLRWKLHDYMRYMIRIPNDGFMNISDRLDYMRVFFIWRRVGRRITPSRVPNSGFMIGGSQTTCQAIRKKMKRNSMSQTASE